MVSERNISRFCPLSRNKLNRQLPSVASIRDERDGAWRLGKVGFIDALPGFFLITVSIMNCESDRALSAVLLRRTALAHEWSLNLLLLGILLTFIADLVFGYQNLNGTYQSQFGSYGLYSISCLLVIVSAHCQYRHTIKKTRAAAKERSERQTFSLPYLANRADIFCW